jgi:hypothetical protein
MSKDLTKEKGGPLLWVTLIRACIRAEEFVIKKGGEEVMATGEEGWVCIRRGSGAVSGGEWVGIMH